MTTWQDWTIFLGQMVLAATLLPTVKAKLSLPLWTVIPTVTTLAVFAFTFATLNFWVSAGSSALNAFVWALILKNSLK